MRRQRILKPQREAIIARAHGCCEYCLCQAKFATQSFSVEHIKPLHLGGDNSLENLALACQGCNGHKHIKQEAMDPADGTSVPLYHPRWQQWHDHFQWREDYTVNPQYHTSRSSYGGSVADEQIQLAQFAPSIVCAW